MNFGILFCDSEKIIQTCLNSPVNLENNAWYCEPGSLETKKLSKIDELRKDVAWISNIPQTNSNIELLQNWQSKFSLKVLRKEWLTPDLKILMLKLGASLPKNGHLILLSINRLIELIEKYNGCEITLSTGLLEQIPDLLNTNLFHYEKDNNIINNYLISKKSIFDSGVRLVTDRLEEYSRVELNMLCIVNQLKNLKIPHGTWKQIPIVDFKSTPHTPFILGIKPDSLIPKNEINIQLSEAVKLTFLQDSSQNENEDSIIWINDCEYKMVSKYFHINPSLIFICDNPSVLNFQINFDIIDILSFTKKWLFSLQIHKFMNDSSLSYENIWIKTNIVHNCFLKAEELVKQRISLAFFDYKYFHFYHNRSDFGTCISTCLQTGLEPNTSLFYE